MLNSNLLENAIIFIIILEGKSSHFCCYAGYISLAPKSIDIRALDGAYSRLLSACYILRAFAWYTEKRDMRLSRVQIPIFSHKVSKRQK